jgi:nucleoside-diphosphate-sugar epimerase
MRVAVAGADSVVGRCVLPALRHAGHQVVPLDRPRDGRPLDVEATALEFEGCDALVNLSTEPPLGIAGRWWWPWRADDRLRSDLVRGLVLAARAAGVRRVVQQSVSFLYADQGGDWIGEESPVCVTTATEAASVAELEVQNFASTCRTGVVLRLGLVLGGAAFSPVRRAAGGRTYGSGAPDGYVPVIHGDDVGPAFTSALSVPTGVYNVGAEPVLRADLVAAHAVAGGRTDGGFVRPAWSRLAGGTRLEPLSRSLRVGSDLFRTTTGWSPRRATFDAGWLAPALAPETVPR